MPELRTCFLNCHNLFPVGKERRMARTALVLDNKLAEIGRTLRESFDEGLPQLIGLCEINNKFLAARLLSALGNPNLRLIWSEVPPSPFSARETGLATIFDGSILDELSHQRHCELGGSGRRYHWMANLFRLTARQDQPLFWWIVNHWKSRMGGIDVSDSDRQVAAYKLGDFFLRRARDQSESVILIGDFNAEPGERPFDRQKHSHVLRNSFRSVRERQLLLRNNRMAYFYSPMWRLMGEMDPVDGPITLSPWPTQRLGTHSKANGIDWLMFDQIMVSKSVIHSTSNSCISLLESRLSIQDSASNCSDHRLIRAVFKY